MFFGRSDISLEILGVFKISRGKSTNKKSVKRSYDSISLRLSGTADFSTNNNRTFCVDNKKIIYIPSHVDYTQSTECEEIIAVHFINYSYTSDNDMEMAEFQNPKEISNLMQRMYLIWNEKKIGYKYECLSILYHILYISAQQFNDDRTPDTAKNLTAATEYIHKNYKNKNIPISYLAKISYVSEEYFRKIFRKMYSVTPHTYIMNLKLEYAAQLITSGFFTISEASEKAGFNSQKYFSRAFKKYYKMTPTQYKNRINTIIS